MKIKLRNVLLESELPTKIKNQKDLDILDLKLQKNKNGEIKFNNTKKLFEILVDDEHKYFIDKNFIIFEYPKYKIKNFIDKTKHDSQDKSIIPVKNRLKVSEFYDWYFN